MNWSYLTQEQQRAGPVSEQELVELISLGSVTRNTLVWNETMDDWTNAAKSSIKSHFGPPPPPNPIHPPTMPVDVATSVVSTSISEAALENRLPVRAVQSKSTKVVIYIAIVVGIIFVGGTLLSLGFPMFILGPLYLVCGPMFSSWYWR